MKVYCLKEINPHLFGPFGSVCVFMKIKLKDKDEINIILHIIYTESNLYIIQKYKKINSTLKEKDKWIYYDEYWLGNFEPRKEFYKEKFIDEFTYAYEDIWSAVPSFSLILILILNMSRRGGQ